MSIEWKNYNFTTQYTSYNIEFIAELVRSDLNLLFKPDHLQVSTEDDLEYKITKVTENTWTGDASEFIFKLENDNCKPKYLRIINRRTDIYPTDRYIVRILFDYENKDNRTLITRFKLGFARNYTNICIISKQIQNQMEIAIKRHETAIKEIQSYHEAVWDVIGDLIVDFKLVILIFKYVYC